jgi:mannose-6-phosphate isomerase-like protein (cupin superfamily)
MLVKNSTTSKRTVDSSMTITDYFSPPLSPKISVVTANLNGNHSKRINKTCDQVYFVLEGSGIIIVNDKKFEVGPKDAVYIPAGATHSMNGVMEVIIINSPPFEMTQLVMLE